MNACTPTWVPVTREQYLQVGMRLAGTSVGQCIPVYDWVAVRSVIIKLLVDPWWGKVGMSVPNNTLDTSFHDLLNVTMCERAGTYT